MSYDANGNILNEVFVGPAPQSPISIGSPEGSFIYDDYDELPRSITTPTGTRNYRYDANGQRIVKEIDLNDKIYYLDGVIVDQNNEVVSYQTPEGYVSVSNNGNIVADYFYSIPDWLGTNRAIMDATGSVVNAHDHYPFGKRMPPARHMVTDAEGNRYQYTGHEFDGETGYGYHGARYYNRELGRYMNVDPWQEKYMGWSSYNYTMGNPTNFIDPTGKGPTDIIKFMDDGTIQRTETNDDFDVLTNESGDNTKTIAHKDGESQIGDIQIYTKNDNSTIQYMLIADNDVARSVFEFAASTTFNETSLAEFGLDMFSFSDESTMNLIQTGGILPEGLSNVAPLGQVGNIDLGEGNLIQDACWIENYHSHPGTAHYLVPSGFLRRWIDGGPVFIQSGKFGDRTFETRSTGGVPDTQYLYGINFNEGPTYIEYNINTAKIIGNQR